MRRKNYNWTPRYKQVAQNEAADLQASMASLSIWIAEHQNANPDLLNLFNRKIDIMLEMHDLCTEIIKFGDNK